MRKLRFDALAFVLILALLGTANLLNVNKPLVSILENRALKTKPRFSLESLFSGRYCPEFEEYYSDTLILRGKLVKANRDVKGLMSFLGGGVTLITSPENPTGPETDPGQNPVADGEPGGEEKPGGEGPKKDFGDEQNLGYWLTIDGKAVQLFKFNRSSFDYYAEILNRYQEELGEGVKIFSLIPPTNSEFVQLRKYKGLTDSQDDAVDYLRSRLRDEIGVVEVFNALKEHGDEYIYFKTDHHWTALGAYYAYTSFMEATKQSPVPLSRYEAVDLGEFLGSSYTKTLSKELEKNPDQFIAYRPLIENEYTMYHGNKESQGHVLDMKYAQDRTNKYLTFISNGGSTWSVVKTGVKNQKRLLVIKDSFGNALIPFLLPHYEEIYIVDSRFYSISATGKDIKQFVQDNGIDEVLFVIYMEDVNWQKFMNGVEGLLGGH